MIKFVVFDFDGVFTDGKVFFDYTGKILKYYNVKDGLGINMLHKKNMPVGVISGYKENQSQIEILKHLKIKYVSLGSNDKLEIVKKWCREQSIKLDNVAFMGDDVNDLELIQNIEISACPKDAHPECLKAANYVSCKNGGEGCVRDFCEYVIRTL